LENIGYFLSMSGQNEKTRILIAEDDPKAALMEEQTLKRAGYHVDIASDGEQALQTILAGECDFLLLDLELPIKSGFEILKEMKKRAITIPVLILSARQQVDDKVKGLGLGADDYITKPFHPKELRARIESILRRLEPYSNTLEFDDLVLDIVARTVTRGGRKIDVTAKEFSLLEYFLKHRGEFVTKDQLLKEIWGFQFDPGTNVVEVSISRLRKSINENSAKTLIATVQGKGYILSVE
jgi:two-component system copper resistance phosphate regulon response regulator CusR